MADASRPTGIQFEQIFLVEATFKHRGDALKLPATTRPSEYDFKLEWRTAGGPDDKTVVFFMRARTEEDGKALYLVNVTLAAIVTSIPGEENITPFAFTQTSAPVLMLPYLREAVANITGRGRFGPMNLPPVNVNLAHPITPTQAPDTTARARKPKKRATTKKKA